MIVIKIQGGLGNQMFQYAYARNLGIETNQPFILDAIALENGEGSTPRRYTLHVFNIQPRLATPQESAHFLATYHIIKEPAVVSIPQMTREASRDAYYDGYWQSEHYFSKHAEKIRADFTLKNPLSAHASLFASDMKKGQSIAIHVRRGDNVTNKKSAHIFGVCGVDYYTRAVAHIAKNQDVELYIISDDIAWCKKELVFPWKTTYISEYGLPDFEELFLITCAKHVIIPNSSFGWWGAWLNPHKDKIVIAPKKWFLNVVTEKEGLVPETWLRF